MSSRLWLVAWLILLSGAGPIRAGIVLEFFQGASVNDTTLSLTPFPNNTVTLVPGGPVAFVQMAYHQIPAAGGPIATGNGLFEFSVQAAYPAGFQSTALIAGLTPTSNLPVYGMGIPDALGPLRYFQPLGSNQSTATS